MEKESVVTGYCRQLDSSRMVCIAAQDGELTEVDCAFESCAYAPGCPVAEKIRQFLQEA